MIFVTNDCYLAILCTIAYAAGLAIVAIVLGIRLHIKIKRQKRIQKLIRLEMIHMQLVFSPTVADGAVTTFKDALERRDVACANELLSKFASRLRMVMIKG